MDVPLFGSVPADINNRNAQVATATRSRRNKRSQKKLVHIHSVKPNPYSRPTNDTVRGSTYKPKYSGDEQRLLECRIEVMELSREIMQLKKELKGLSPDESPTKISSTVVSRQDITSSNPMAKSTSARLGSSAMPAGLSNSQVPLTPTTPLPSLKTLLVDTASSTLINGLKRTPVEYKKQNQSADVSDMVPRLDELIAYYQAVSLVMGISAFIRSIKDSLPDVAQIYDEKLKKFTDDLKEVMGQGKKQDRSRRTPIADMVKLMLTDLYEFVNAPMNLQMREFFKGFEADRDLFARIMSEQTTDVPADFQELFQNMNSGANIISAMDAYNRQIKDLLTKRDFAEVGKMAPKVNILFRAADLLIENGELDADKVLEDPYKDLLNKFQQFELTNEALWHITESSPASLPLHEIIAYGYVYDSLRVARLGAASDKVTAAGTQSDHHSAGPTFSADTTESGNGTSITDTTKLAIRTEPPVISTPADQTRQSSSEAHRQQSTAASSEETFPGITSLAQQVITGVSYFRGSLNQTLTEEGKPVFTPVHLIKAINNNLSTRREHDLFDLFLLKLSHQPDGSGKLKTLRESYQKIKDEKPLLVSGYGSTASLQRLNTILDSEKGLFIDQVKGLQLRDNQHFSADIPLDEERKRLLFLGSDLLDAIRYPNAYRLQLDHKKDSDAEPTQETAPRRMRREAGLPPATSSAARPGGILDSVVFGVLGGLFASGRGQTTMPPALSSPTDEHQDGGSVHPLNHSTRLDNTGNLALATLLTAKFNDRQVTFSPVEIPTFSEQDLLATSPGIRLLNVNSRIILLLQMEVTDFVNHFDDGKPIVNSWDLDDLVNMAILKVLPDTAAKVSETFLYEVLKSPHIGEAHERPENIFAADGRVRDRPDGDPVIFHNQVTGQTSTGGPGMSLAKAMLQALAWVCLASYQDDGLPETLHRRIVRQAAHLSLRQCSGSWWATIAGPLSAPGIVDTLDARIAARNSIMPEAQSLDPVITFLSRERYDQGKKLFMQLSALQQFNRVEALANEPDYLGLDYSAAPLEQLRADMFASIKNGRKIPHWQSLQFSQQAWQQFSHLCDSEFAAPTEAVNRINMTTTLSRGLIGGEKAQQLSKLFVSLLPQRTSASDFVSVSLAHPAQQAHSQTLVQLHQFGPVQIGELIGSYEALKSYAEKHFAEVFGDAISDPELRWELIILVAQTSLEGLQSALLGSWKNVVKQALKEEYAEIFQEHNDNNELEVELGV